MINRYVVLVRHKAEVLACAAISLYAAFSTVALSQTAAVQIRVLNGHNGKPISHEGISVRFVPVVPHGIENQPSTDANGTLLVNAPINAGMNASINYYPTCRHVPNAEGTKGPITFPSNRSYPTASSKKITAATWPSPPNPENLHSSFVRFTGGNA